MNKQKDLEKVNKEIITCRICPVGKSGKPVVGEGNPDADIVFIGEAPGRLEAQSGRPFIGGSGQLLRGLIREAGLREEDVYITSPVKYLPDRGTPTPKDIAQGRIQLMKQLNIIQPKVIVLLGNSAIQGVLEMKIRVKTDHGKIIKKDGKIYLITLHPAAGLRFPPLKELIKEDFGKLNTIIKSA